MTHGDPNTEWIESYSYFGGTGQTLMIKAQAEPGLAPQRDQNGELVLDQNGEIVLVDTSPDLRWIGNGRTVLDNKGNPVRQYEPYYSSTHEYEDEVELVEQGVSPLIHYDPIGRVIRTDFPDGTFSKVEFTPWESTHWDANDTVAESDWYAARYNYGGGDVYWQKERRAAELAYEHRDTPSKMVFDSLGRPFLGIEDLGNSTTYETEVVLDIRGLPSQIIDARGNIAEGRTYGILGQVLETTSVDAGDRQALTTILGEPLRAWDAKDQRARVTYDDLRRPVDSYVQPAVGSEILLSRTIYGEALASPQSSNHRGRLYRTYDGGGESTTPAFDFKGLPTSSEVKLLLDPTAKNDWTVIANQSTIAAMATAAASSLESTTYTASSSHDALGRVLTAISPDGSEVAYTYNERGALKTVDCKHRGSLSSTPVVADITYDVRGRRESITYASNATTTTYEYDPLNFRLRAIETTRSSDSTKLQGLHYHYDPVGNITDIRDDAQQTVYFQNAIVEAANSYTYDALYRLVEATGREHATQGTAQRDSTQLLPDSSAIPMANDPNALRRYTQSYTYDPVGNLETVVHAPASGTGWTRRYQYREDGNRLVATSAPGDSAGPLYTNSATYSHTYPHDEHGNFTAMPHISAMAWDEADQLHQCTVGSQDVYFQYAGGVRIRKYVDHSGGTTEVRIYLGAFELYRKHVSGVLKEEWESLHISDDAGRIVLIETHTVDDGNAVGSPSGIWRFQLSNHLGSAATEVTETGAIISYEEYHPYGTSAYRLVDSQIDVPAKRYRYTGMERDEETGLGYHTARYYAPWLGRWTAADPYGLYDGENRYSYINAHPTKHVDPAGTNGEPYHGPGSNYYAWENDGAGSVFNPVEPQFEEFDFEAEEVLASPPSENGQTSSLPVGEYKSRDYAGIVDIQNPAESKAITAGELCEGDNSALCQTVRDNSALPQMLENIADRVHKSQAMGLRGTVAYGAILFAAPVLIEGGIVAVPAFMNTGSVGFATFEAAGHLSAGISTYAQGSTFAAFSVAAVESVFVADAVAHGLPLDVVMPGRGFGTKPKRSLAPVSATNSSLAEGNAVGDLLYGGKPGEGLPGAAGVPISGRPTIVEMENLTAKHGVEFAVTYRLGPGRGGGGGQYYLYSGTVSSVTVPNTADHILLYHTHPMGTPWASGPDMANMRLRRANGSPQRTSYVIPVGRGEAVPYTETRPRPRP